MTNIHYHLRLIGYIWLTFRSCCSGFDVLPNIIPQHALSVKDINASKEFYETLGFGVFAGTLEKNYLIMKNENSLIGLFQGMFENNILTFNPGWDQNATKLEAFDDVREIQRQLKNNDIPLVTEANENTSGPAGFMITDPDGNVILIDQHI